MAAYRWENNVLVIQLHIKARSRRFSFGPVRGEAIQVCIAAAPEQGKATDALLYALADFFDVRPRAITLVSGAFTPRKVVRVDSPNHLPDFVKHPLENVPEKHP